MYRRWGKLVLDVLVALAALTFLFPVFLLAAFLIIADDGPPVLFRQQRVGVNGKPFTVLKLRTMRRDTPHVVATMVGPGMVTRVGKVLRRTNLDEIPQFVNILRGEMSLVGPRPILPSQTYLIGLRRDSGALACRPGLTGLAQVNSYDGMPEDEKAKYDAKYCARVTLRNDVTILVRTVSYLTRRPPVY